MDFAQTEVDAVSAVIVDPVDQVVLNELELSLVGGGQGDVAFG